MATPHSPRPTAPIKISHSAGMMLGLIRIYQYGISPLLGPRCRFYPSCSQYAIEAIQRYGAIQGGWLAIKRIIRCNPLSAGGEDPVPCRCDTKKSALQSSAKNKR